MRNVNTRAWIQAAVGCLPALLLAACAVGPDYQRPEMNAPDAFKSANAQETAQPELALDWWKLFQDQELDALVDEALKANQSLRAAVARVDQARASAASVRGSLFPAVNMNASATRSRRPASGASSEGSSDTLSRVTTVANDITGLINQIQTMTDPSSTDSTTGGAAGSSTQSASLSAGSSSVSATNNAYQVGFDLSYEIDIWGRVRRSCEAARAEVQVSVYDLEVVRQTLLADLVQNYFSLRALDAQNDILARTLDLYQEQTDLTQQRFTTGLATETDFLQARIQLESARAQHADIRRQRAGLEHAIAILLGRPPVQFSLDERPLDAEPPQIPAGLPADILRRRPDVAKAEQNLAAACAQIGVAKANFYPVVKLTGAAGFESADIKDALDWENRVWSIGPSVSLPIFQGGQLRANLRQAKAKYQELEAAFRETVLIAFGDVEDALTDLHMRADQAQARAHAVDAAREYLRLAQLEYQVGLSDYRQVVDAQKALLDNELSVVQTLDQRMASTVLLIKSLGGGWDSQVVPPQHEQAPAETSQSLDLAKK